MNQSPSYVAMLFGLGLGLGFTASCAIEDEPDTYSTDESELLQGSPSSERPEVGFIIFNNSGCTATLVGARAVLTAAHCVNYVTGPTSGSYHTGTGPSYPFDYATSASTSGPNQFDIAVLRLTTDVPANVASPAPLSANMPSWGEWVSVFGYGCTSRLTGAGAGTKRKHTYQYYNNAALGCPVDSGGPTFRSDGTIVFVFSGYNTSTGLDIYAVIPNSLGWIYNVINSYNGPAVHDGTGTYRGCFLDAENRGLPVYAGAFGNMTPGMCRQSCAGGGYAYAGVQYYYQCFCGNELRWEQRPDSECNTPCGGNGGVMCGGGWRNSVYATGASGGGGGGGGSAQVTFFWDIEYSGASVSVSADVPFVGWEWNDRASSVRVPAGRTVILYEHWDFGGASLTLNSDTNDLRAYGWNDFASSARIY